MGSGMGESQLEWRPGIHEFLFGYRVARVSCGN